MHNYYPILWVGAIIGVISTLLIVAAFVVKDGEKETGFERNMKDSEIMQRLMDYAKPFYRQFIVVGFLMLFSIAYDIICHENDKRYERDFADVHQPSGQSSEELLRDHRYSDCDAVSEL